MIFDRALSPDESSLVLSHVQALQSVDCFHARALVQTHEKIEQWYIEVDNAGGSWFAVAENGDIEEFRDRTTFHRGGALTRSTTISGALPIPVQPGFPEKLAWWGGHDHGFRPVMVERIGKKSILLTFEHGSDPSMRSTMVLDTEIGLVTRIMHFDSPYIVLLDIEPGKPIERRTTRSFPELEVVYPNY